MTTLHRKLFHLGLLAIDDQMMVLLSPNLKDISKDTAHVTKLDGKRIALPQNPEHWPNPDALKWHRKWVYKA